jgi:hypothetical protein
MQAAGAPRTFGSVLHYLLLAIAMTMYAASVDVAWLHLTQGPPAQRVHIRWAPTVSISERVQAEREHGLVDGVPFEGRTWQYFLRKRSRTDIQQLLSDPRVEDTFHINRAAFRVELDRVDLSPRMRSWLESDRLGQLSLALALAAAFMTWWLRRTLRAALLAARRGAHRSAVSVLRAFEWIEGPSASLPSNSRLAPRWLIVLASVWAVIAIPYVAVGPPDFEEYFTGVVSTQVAMKAIAHGAWPFWNLDFGLGAPQPLRFHFITHPFAPLCLMTDCQALLRSIAAIHLVIGAMFMTLLVRRLVSSWSLAVAAGLTFCLSSSVVQPMLLDDWPLTAMHESALPIMLYGLLALDESTDWRGALLWALVLGGISGLILSMTVPIVTLVIVAIVAVSAPGLGRRLPWLVLAAAITLLMGAEHLHHIYAELVRSPSYLGRTGHDDHTLAGHLWSAFIRPLSLSRGGDNWRTVFFGPPFAVAAAGGAIFLRDARTRPFRVGLLLGLVGLIVPPAWLFNINTARWLYRAELNVFGIVMAACAIDRWTSSPPRIRLRTAIVVTQLCWIALTFEPVWYSTVRVAAGLEPPHRNVLISPGIAEEIAARERVAAGRVIFGPEAHAALRIPWFNTAGLAPNELPALGVPTISAVVYGITTDELSPQSATLEGEITATASMIRSHPLLDVLGVRYVMAYEGDSVADGLPEIERWPNGLRMYENDGAWPEAFFVDDLRNDRIPRLAGCGHDRFLCADFSQYDLQRRDDPLQITRLDDGFRLTFPPRDSRRYILITQWYYAEWRVTDGRASVHRAAEQLIGIEVAPGERTVTVQYRPYLRAALFGTGIATEVVIAVAIVMLATSRMSAGRSKPAVTEE